MKHTMICVASIVFMLPMQTNAMLPEYTDHDCDEGDIIVLHHACKRNDLREVARLIKKDPRLVHVETSDYDLPLHVVCDYLGEHCSTDIINLLLCVGASINRESRKSSKAPLEIVIESGKWQMMNKLLKWGADPNVGYEVIPLVWSVYQQCTASVLGLVSAGARVTDAILHKAELTGDKHIIEWLRCADALCARKWTEFFCSAFILPEITAPVSDNQDLSLHETAQKIVDLFRYQLYEPQRFPEEMPRFYNTIAELRRLLIAQGASPQRQLLVIARLMEPGGMLCLKPLALSHIQSFLPAADILRVQEAFPLGLATPGSTLAALP